MAFSYTIPRSGDDYILGDNMHTKVPKSGYTAQVGDLVRAEGAQNNEVDLIAADEAILGIVEKVEQNGLLTVIEFVPGTYIKLPYTGTVVLGQKVEFSSNTRDVDLARTKVKDDNTNGSGSVVDIDSHGAGVCVVRF